MPKEIRNCKLLFSKKAFNKGADYSMRREH